jgi:hypothetical protein
MATAVHLLLLLPAARSAHAADVSEKRPERRAGTFGLAITTLKEQGFGGGMRLRFDHFAVEASVAAMPFFVLVTGDCEKLVFKVAPHATGSVLVIYSDVTARFQNGLRLSGMWNGILGGGTQVGWFGELLFNNIVALDFGAGVQLYPAGKTRAARAVRDACGGDGDSEVSIIQSVVQLYVGLNLLFYVF